jgi:hypothetical protein
VCDGPQISSSALSPRVLADHVGCLLGDHRSKAWELGGETEVMQLPSTGWKFRLDQGCERGMVQLVAAPTYRAVRTPRVTMNGQIA